MTKRVLEPPPNLSEKQWEELLSLDWDTDTRKRHCFREALECLHAKRNVPTLAKDLFGNDPQVYTDGPERLSSTLQMLGSLYTLVQVGEKLTSRGERMIALAHKEDV